MKLFSDIRSFGSWLSALLFLLLSCQVAIAGDLSSHALPFLWFKQPKPLPDSIRVYEGIATAADGQPLRAWYADIDTSDKNLRIFPVLSSDKKGREPASAMAYATNSLVAINGGYFDMGAYPAKTFSLVMREGQVMVPNIARVLRSNGRYPVTRGAFGILPDGSMDIAWIAHIKGEDGAEQIYAYDEPTRNTKAVIAEAPTATSPAGARLWKPQNAIGGGPVLLSGGEIIDTYENEAFFGSGFPSVLPYPRAAIGYTKDNHLIFFVVDGRQPGHSVGLTLQLLSEELRKLGCVEALNLDGGGSAVLVVNGQPLNRPSDAHERNVTSILGVASNDLAFAKLPAPPAATPTPSPAAEQLGDPDQLPAPTVTSTPVPIEKAAPVQ